MVPDSESTPEQRAEARRQRPHEWPIRSHALGREPEVDPLDNSTIDERIALVWVLTMEAWHVSGHELPDYERHQMPGSITRSAG